MAIEHTITDSDTIYSLAEQYLFDPNRWREIVDYNGLSAPYIVGSRSEVEDRYGNGYLTVTRTNFTNEAVIEKGWTFRTKLYVIGDVPKEFKTTERTIVPAGERTFYLHVRAVEPGSYGNVAERMVTEVGEEFLENNIAIESVYNEKTFEGGSNRILLTTGDLIYIPTNIGESPISEDLKKNLQSLGGEDLLLDGEESSRYFVEDGYGDLRSISGVDNIKQAINDRLTTEKGELAIHPEYGTNIASIVGSHRTPYTDKLIEIEIYEALSYEDRIRDVEIIELRSEGTTVHVSLSFRPAVSNRSIEMSLAIDYNNRG